MGINNVLLQRRGTLRAAIETTYGTPVALAATDAILCTDPDFSTDVNTLERDFTSNTLSPQAHIIGRMLAKTEFTTELRGNGRQNSGVDADAPVITRLFRACGYAYTPNAAAFVFGPFQNDVGPTIAFSNVSAGTVTELTDYLIQVTVAGPSGTAKAIVKSAVTGETNAVAATITSGTPFAIGTKGVTLTMTWAGSLVVGQEMTLWASPAGFLLQPRSDNFESLTLEVTQDRIKHVVPGCFGTFEITAQAGQFSTVKWTFWGLYVPPVDGSLPAVTYERQLPAQVELAKLRLDGDYLVVEKFSYNQQNSVNVRPDVNSSQGYIGTRITSRKPTGGIDPEADLVASHDFWGRLSAAQKMPFSMRVGSKVGNIVWMIAENTQYSGLTYQARDGILTFDAGLKFSRSNGDDEFALIFN